MEVARIMRFFLVSFILFWSAFKGRASYYSTRPLDCTGTIYVSFGDLSFYYGYKHNENYSNNERCFWTVRSDNHRATLNLISEGFENGYDLLYAYTSDEFGELQSELINDTERNYDLRGTYIFLSFASDQSVVGTGFTIQVEWADSGISSNPCQFSSIHHYSQTSGRAELGPFDEDTCVSIVVNPPNFSTHFQVDSLVYGRNPYCMDIFERLRVIEVFEIGTFTTRYSLCRNHTSPTPAASFATNKVILLLFYPAAEDPSNDNFSISWEQVSDQPQLGEKPPWSTSTENTSDAPTISSSTPISIETTTTPIPQPKLQLPHVILEEANYSEKAVELNYTVEFNNVTLQEERVVRPSLSKSFYRCLLATCTAPYPIKWATSLLMVVEPPLATDAKPAAPNKVCSFGQSWTYSMSRKLGFDPFLNNKIDKEFHLHPERRKGVNGSKEIYQIRLGLKVSISGNGRITCQSKADSRISTDYYIFTPVGQEELVKYTKSVVQNGTEIFWQLPSEVETKLFSTPIAIDRNTAISEFFTQKKFLDPKFNGIFNNSRKVIIPCVTGHYYDIQPQPPILQLQDGEDKNTFMLILCNATFPYEYFPSSGFVFDELDLLKAYFVSPCNEYKTWKKDFKFVCKRDMGPIPSVTVYVTGYQADGLEMVRDFVRNLPEDSTVEGAHTYLRSRPYNRDLNFFPCHFLEECEVISQCLDHVESRSTTCEFASRWLHEEMEYYGEVTNNIKFRSGLFRSFKYNDTEQKQPTFEFVFTGLSINDQPPKRYLQSDSFPHNAVISLKHIIQQNMSYDQEVQESTRRKFRCEISNFVLVNNINMYLMTRNDISDNRDFGFSGDNGGITFYELLQVTNHTAISDSMSYSWSDLLETEAFSERFGSSWADAIVDITENVVGVMCIAPWQNSSEWINVTLEFTKPQILKFHGNVSLPILFKKGQLLKVNCSATGSPNPNITWVPENNNLLNYVTTACLKNGECTPEFQPPVDKKYEGKYICTATNEFGMDKYEVVLEYEDEESGSGITWKGMTGIGIGAFVFIALICGTLLFYVKKYRDIKNRQRDLTEDEIREFLNGNPDEQIRASDSSNPVVEPIQGLNENSCIDVNAFPLDQQFFLQSNDLMIEKSAKLGEGEFGVVYRGLLNEEAVAVKSTKPNADVSYVKAFLAEIKIMAYVARGEEETTTNEGKTHIIKFVGVAIDRLKQRGVLAVVELSPFGNLHSYLESIRVRKSPEFKNMIVNDEFERSHGDSDISDSSTSSPNKSPVSDQRGQPKRITTIDLVHWCSQIAAGMDYLASKKVIHGDLATRNILVFPHNMVKITDFGMSRKLYAYSQYVRKKDKKVAIPWAWMALESLQHNQFSLQSDIWSFGVTMWEIFSMGQFPHPGHQYSPEFISALADGMRMGKPVYASSTIYNQMWNCWDAVPENRPTYQSLHNFLKNILQQWVSISAGEGEDKDESDTNANGGLSANSRQNRNPYFLFGQD